MRGPGGEPAVFELPADGPGHVIATADHPEHAVHRALAQPRLAARRVAGLEGPVRGWTRAALRRDGAVDRVQAVGIASHGLALSRTSPPCYANSIFVRRLERLHLVAEPRQS